MRQVHGHLRDYLQNGFADFEPRDFAPGRRWRDGAALFVGWFLPATASVVAVKWMGRHRTTEYLEAAIKEGIGPHLWNVIGIFGFSLFGLALLFPRVSWFALIANRVLINCFAIGALSCGLIAGQRLTTMASEYVASWRFWLFGSAVWLLMIFLLLVNLLLWYGGILIYYDGQPTPFLDKVGSMPLGLRICAGILCVAIPLAFLVAER